MLLRRFLLRTAASTTKKYSSYVLASKTLVYNSKTKWRESILNDGQDIPVRMCVSKRSYATPNDMSMPENIGSQLDSIQYDRVCSVTLDGLCEYFEEIIDNATHLTGTDVSYGDGVLTINLGSQYGTYVINRQTPNKQIWLSSPTSGPKRYDFMGPKAGDGGKWIYKHTGETMHELLQNEMKVIFGNDTIDFFKLPYSR